MRDITLRQLEMLVATAEHRSLAGAAAALHVTGPAIAAQLRLLDKRVGIPLLERRADGLHPTEAGRELIACAQRVADDLTSTADALAALESGGRGQVTLGAVSTAKYFTPRVIAELQREHPGIDVRLVVGNRAEMLDALEGYSVDLVIMGRASARLDVVDAVFGDHPYVVVAPPGHALAGVRRIDVARLAEEVILVREPGSGTRLHTENLLEGTGFRVGMEVSSNETLKQAVMAGLGVALISAHTIEAEQQDGRLVVLDVVGLPIMRQWRIVRLASRPVNPALQIVWDFVTTAGGDLLPDARLATVKA
ncbi:MAG: hypothetical protein RL347_1035 [Actinomycetota bacterium]|jgi:LysR family transcriptional regulator for metE and metH